MYVLNFLLILLEVLLLFNLLIFVHELGHFLAARWRGLKIERFAVWFGKPIWQKEINGVVYCLGSIPAGGYVALPQMASMETIEGKTDQKQDELPPISALDKIIVAFAGPLFSLGLALAFATVVWMIGRPVGEAETTTTIGYVAKGSPAEAAGLQPNDKIESIDGKPVHRFSGIGDTVMWRIVSSEGVTVPVTVLRTNIATGTAERVTVHPKPKIEKTETLERKALREIGIAGFQTPLVAKVTRNSPAALAKIEPNDIILEANGIHLYHPATLSDVIKDSPDKPITLKVLRDNRIFEVAVKPVMPEGIAAAKDIPEDEKRPMLGIGWEMGGRMTVDHPDPISQIKASVTAMVGTISALLSPKSDIKLQHLSGPVGIMRIYYRLFESEQGWRLAIWFSVVLNVNLALLNLLPIPVLDGGHILLALIESVRRKPANVRILNWIQTGCAVLIIGYMLYVTFFDFQDFSFKRTRKLEFSPPAASAPNPNP
jgi:regulator of sigma E protease